MSAPRVSRGQLAVLAVYAGMLGFAAGIAWHRHDEERQEFSRRLRAVERKLEPADEHKSEPVPVRIVEV